MCDCLSHAPYWGPSPQPRPVPWLGIELLTLWFTGWHSIHWATPARINWFLIRVLLWNNCLPHICCNVPSNVVVLRGGAFRGWLGHEGGALRNGINALFKTLWWPQAPRQTKTLLLGKTFEELSNYFPESEDKGQVSVWARLNCLLQNPWKY